MHSTLGSERKFANSEHVLPDDFPRAGPLKVEVEPASERTELIDQGNAAPVAGSPPRSDRQCEGPPGEAGESARDGTSSKAIFGVCNFQAWTGWTGKMACRATMERRV